MPPKSTAPKPWTEDNAKTYNWLYNNYKEINPDAEKATYIDKYKKYLMTYIENNYNWSNASKEKFLLMVGRYLHNKQSWRYSKLYQEKGIEYIKKSQQQEYKNELDEKEMLNFRDHQYFTDILVSIDPSTITNKIEHMKYLLLACLTYQPPLRTSFYNTAKFIRFEKDNDKTHNFVQINKQGKLKVRYIVNDDKVSKTKTYAMNKNLNYINIIDEKLVTLINDSYTKYPRTYLFENVTNKPITTQMLLKWLREITKVSEINVDIMRASYITWYYASHHKYADREALAKMMRHSVSTAEKNYNKVFDNKTFLHSSKPTAENCDDIKQELHNQQKENDDLKLKLEAYTNEPAQTDDIKHYKKKRSDILYNLNRKGRIPRGDTLTKYNITFDKALNLYV